MKTGILLLFLFLCSVSDWKIRKISLYFCVLGAFVIIVYECLAKEFSLEKMIGGILVGLFLLGLTKMTREQIGLGDGIVFLVIGLGLGFRESFLLLIESLCLLFLFSVIGLMTRKIRIKQRLPFLPFVFVAYLFHVCT